MKKQVLIGALVAVGAAGPAAAQQDAPDSRERVTVAFEPQAVTSIRTHSVAERVTKGRPYSAEAVTEFVQVLGDGNRIERRTTVRVFRDGEGRTRREELGPDGTAQSISIYDPASHVTYVLDPSTRTAHKSIFMTIFPGWKKIAEAGAVTVTEAAPLEPPAEMAVAVPPERRAAAGEVRVFSMEAAEPGAGYAVKAGAVGAGAVVEYGKAMSVAGTREPLGEQEIGGVRAEGSRTTTTIPAGQIGNEREIKAVSEQWFSPDLQVLVMTKHSDPRSGETTYRLTNILRGEPGAALFEVPADYTIREPGEMRLRKPE
jgi:hypothetical protein